MNNATQTLGATRRKLIDIPEDVFQILSMRAAAMGTNLKRYIENLLVREYEDATDAEVYKYLVATRPEGKVRLTPEEQAEFEARHGLGQLR